MCTSKRNPGHNEGRICDATRHSLDVNIGSLLPVLKRMGTLCHPICGSGQTHQRNGALTSGSEVALT